MEMFYRNTFEQAPIGIAYASRQGRFLRCNRACQQMLGFTSAELEGMSIWQLTHESDLAHSSAAIERLWRGEIDSYSMEKRYVRKDSVAVWVRVTAALVRDQSGTAQCSVGFLEAISDRKLMEEALQQSRNLLETMIADIPFAIIACDNDGRVFISNPAAVDLLAIHAGGECVAESSAMYPSEVEVCLPDGVTRVATNDRPLARALRGETVSNVELMVLRQGGPPRATLATARQLLDANGTCLGAVAVAQDISERKQADLELERVHRQLLDSSRLAGMAEVASNVLHNVGNVLTSVNVSASLVAECVKNTKIAGLGRAAALLKRKGSGCLPDFGRARPQVAVLSGTSCRALAGEPASGAQGARHSAGQYRAHQADGLDAAELCKAVRGRGDYRRYDLDRRQRAHERGGVGAPRSPRAPGGGC
jgi:PAS domain S-box-containing protein